MQWQELLGEVVRRRWPALVAYASLYAGDRAAAEDLAHEAVVRTFGRPRPFTDLGGAEGYVRTVIRSVHVDAVRKDRAWRVRRHLVVVDDVRPSPERAVEASVDVRAALDLLTRRERACVVLRFFEDLPVADIAADLAISEGSVKRYLSDGTRKLREALGDRVEVAGLETAPVEGVEKESSR